MSDKFKLLLRYPSAAVGLLIISLLIIISIVTVITIPYSEAIRLWRGDSETWQEYPRTAWPAWINILPGINRPTTINLTSETDGVKDTRSVSEDITEVNITIPFNFQYDDFPSEMSIFFKSSYKEQKPHVELFWINPKGEEIHIGSLEGSGAHRMSVDDRLTRKLGGKPAHIGLFADPDNLELPIKGEYTIRMQGFLFGDQDTLDARMVVYGQVHGFAGTDHLRRDLMVGLLWGIPVALAFGFLAAVGAQLNTFLLAAIGVWYGKWLDGIFRWITQVNLILPILPLLIMIGMFFSRSIWVILGAVILLSIFGSHYFVLRAMFLQIKGAPYIDAAKAYGAGDARIIFRYLIPKIIPVLLPQFVSIIPAYVFLEATISVLGLGDLHLPTLGKIIHDAHSHAAIFNGQAYWMIQPSILLIVMGIAFAMLGYTLDRVFNPRLRQI